MKKLLPILMLTGIIFYSCNNQSKEQTTPEETVSPIQAKVEAYTPVTLKTDLSKLSDKQRQMIPLLIEASKIMDKLFWIEAYGNKDSLLSTINDEWTKRYIEINYGPWDRLDNNRSFVEGVGKKPAGANFYPADMTKEEFEAAALEGKTSLYTFLRRDENKNLIVVPYKEMFAEDVQKAADLLKQAAELAEDNGLKQYLLLRADALLTDEYFDSDMAWMDMKDNTIDIIIGPIENYEDKLYNYKAAHEAYVLVKDKDWSARLAKYADYLPELQKGLPADEKYKQDAIGSKADLNAYDVIYYAGDCNSGSKTIAINLPNDEKVQAAKGSRRLQLKNVMRAKFDEILVPVSKELIESNQLQYVKFEAFFENVMFHEVAHGLGIKNTINGKGTVREALKEHSTALEEGKADVLGLYMITQLHEKGELTGSLEEYYVTFMASIFRSSRFGTASAHGVANMIRFNYFKEMGAFERNHRTGKYQVNFEKMKEAMNSLSALILQLQGDGDYEGVSKLVAKKGVITSQLKKDLDLLREKNIPVDIVFEQGTEVLGL